jgi:hypothetical protein
MKKILLFGSILFINSIMATGQVLTATDFTANDCSGTSHHLFSELEAGKVIVVSFVMPCGSCISPSLSAKSTVNTYATSHPGKVVFYLSDDDAGTSCATLTSWAASNGLSAGPLFSTTSFVQTQYGTPAMPKVVVLGGSNHHVYFTEDNSLNATNLQAAINAALASTAVKQVENEGIQLSIFPNPATGKLSADYTLSGAAHITADIYNAIGSKVATIISENQNTGKHTLNLNESRELSNGVYFLKLTTETTTETAKFIIAN